MQDWELDGRGRGRLAAAGSDAAASDAVAAAEDAAVQSPQQTAAPRSGPEPGFGVRLVVGAFAGQLGRANVHDEVQRLRLLHLVSLE